MLKFLFYFCIAALSIGQLSAISKGGGLNFYLFDVAVGVFALYGLLYFLTVKNKIRFNTGLKTLLLFSFWAFITFISNSQKFSLEENYLGAFYLVRWLMYVLAGIVVSNILNSGYIKDESIYKAFIISGVFITFAGFVQLYLLPDFETLDPSLGWDPHKNRLASTFFDPNFTGSYLVMILTLLLDKFSKKKKMHLPEVLSGTLMVIGVLLTFSRSAWVMLAIVILVYGIFKIRMLLFIALLTGFLAYYAVPRIQTRISGITDPADSAHFRFISWSNTWEIAQDNLLIGVGYNFFRPVQKEYGFVDADTVKGHSSSGSDSSLLYVLATTGVIGLGFYLLGLFQLFNPLRSKNTIGIALLTGLLIDSLFINSLFFPQIMFVIFSVTALSEFS